MKKKFAEFDVPTAKWDLLESENDFEKLKHHQLAFPLIVKTL